MRKQIRGWFGIAATAVVLSALVLAGCSANAEDTSAAQPADTLQGETAVPDDGEPAATPAPVVLDPSGLSDVQPTPVAVGESVIVTELLGSPVTQQAEPVGTVRGLILDVPAGRARYLVVDGSIEEAQRTFLLPWGMFDIARQAPNEAGAAVERTAAAVPTGSPQDLTGVEIMLKPEAAITAEIPDLGVDTLEAWQESDELPEGWDDAARRYWAAHLLDARMSGTDDGMSQGPVFFLGETALESSRWQARDEDNNVIGQVQEIFLDPKGTAAFAAVYLPNYREQDDLNIVMPWRMLVWKPEIRSFFLTPTSDLLTAAPVFDRSTLPDLSVPGWDQDWQRYWQQERTPGSQVTVPQEQRGQSLISRLIGRTMKDASGSEIGAVEDLVMGTEGNILYVVLRSDDQLVPVPWITFDYADDTLIYIDDPNRLEDAPGYASVDEIDPAVPDWDRELRTYWGLGR